MYGILSTAAVPGIFLGDFAREQGSRGGGEKASQEFGIMG